MRFRNKLVYWAGLIRRGVKKLRPPEPYDGPEILTDRYRIAVHFADDPVNLYQIRQWYAPLREINTKWPVLVVARKSATAKILLEESGLDVAYAQRIVDLEAIAETQPLDVVLYVNQNHRNFQMMRYPNPSDVFINHGESDKAYMESSQHKAYDYAFVAGEAAAQRLSNALWGYDVEQRTVRIGRPQMEFMTGVQPYPDDSRVTVLYAPTWEGDLQAMSYGSVVTHGERLVQWLLQHPKYRVIYRPHPRSGTYSSEYRQAHERILKSIERANSEDPSAHHMYDTSAELTWQLRSPELVVCDISAMLYDRLAIGKPLLVARPESERAEVANRGYLTDCEWLKTGDLENLETVLRETLYDETKLGKLKEWSVYYFGDTSEVSAMQKFGDAIERLLLEGARRRGVR
ncbi:MAG: CDP-glycerol glycerophosphotransferase family protein [Canibacter sp.]